MRFFDMRKSVRKNKIIRFLIWSYLRTIFQQQPCSKILYHCASYPVYQDILQVVADE